MMRLIPFIFFCAFVFTCKADAQNRLYSIAIKGSYITTSKIFLYPNAADEFLRGKHLLMDNIFGGGIELRRQFVNKKIQFGISIEYLEKSEDFSLEDSHDGYRTIPIELSGYFYIPIFQDVTKIYIGAGGGIYFGERLYVYKNIPAKILSTKPGYGIHILSGADYSLTNKFAIRGQVKFRDLNFRTTNQFTQEDKNKESTLDTQSFVSQTNIDGMTVELGIVYVF